MAPFPNLGDDVLAVSEMALTVQAAVDLSLQKNQVQPTHLLLRTGDADDGAPEIADDPTSRARSKANTDHSPSLSSCKREGCADSGDDAAGAPRSPRKRRATDANQGRTGLAAEVVVVMKPDDSQLG